MNNKGFTLIELLATITLIGVLSIVAIAGTTKYLTQSRNKSYKIMSQSIYEAANNCAVESACVFPTSAGGSVTITTSELINKKYLDALKNPISSRKDCSGSVKIYIPAGSSVDTEYKDYKYTVDLSCSGIDKINYTWPDAKSMK